MADKASFRRRELITALVALGGYPPSNGSANLPGGADLESLLKPQFSLGEPGCAVVVTQGRSVIFRAAYGSSGRSGVSIQPESQFKIGSITKTFTAALALKLVEAGKLHLDRPVGVHLAHAPGDLAPLTLRQLLSHTAGLGQYTELPEFRRIASRSMTEAELLALCGKTPRLAPAGERHIYSNTGYAVIGCLIAAVTGKSFEQALYDEILVPVGLNDTGFEDKLGNSPRLVLGHGRLQADGSRAAVPSVHPSAIAASGGLISTVDDLVRWNAARVSGALLSPASTALLTAPVAMANGASAPTGLGWMLRDVLDQRAIEHSGSTQGFVGHVMYLPASDMFVAVLMNESSGRQPGPGFLCEQLAAAMLGKPISSLTIVDVEPAAMQMLLGDYGAPDVRRHIELYQGRLMVRRGPSRALLEALSPTHFVDRRRAVVHYKFIADSKGVVTTLTIQRAGSEDLILPRQ